MLGAQEGGPGLEVEEQLSQQLEEHSQEVEASKQKAEEADS